MWTFVSSVIPSMDFECAFLIRTHSFYIFFCSVTVRKGCSFASISLHWLGPGSCEHLHFSEEASLEPDLRLLPTEANHFTFISTALQIAFQVGRTVKALFSLGRGTLSPCRGHLCFMTWGGLSVKSSHSCWRQTHIPGAWHHKGRHPPNVP